MAESPAHKLGQLIGNLLEELIEPFLSDFATRRNLYLDYQKNSRAARKGKKVTWEDPYGNVHDLDYVLERDGTGDATGTPVAFIEVAWRRYTKHSRNKAQEIQGAILPLAEKYHALRFLDRHSVYERCGDFRRYEVLISFTNGDRVEGSFKDRAKVHDFLQFIAQQ